jgi:hypothetical protein
MPTRTTIWRLSGEVRVGVGHPLLKLKRSRNRIDRTGEFDQHAITHEFDDPP